VAMSEPVHPEDPRGLRLAVGLYVVVFVLKLGAYFVTGSMAVLAEALHTMADIVISAFLLLALRLSGKVPDEEHMFGHGQAQNLAAVVAATLFISFTSYKLYEEAIPRLFNPGHAVLQNMNLAVGVLVVSMFIAAAPLVTLLRQRKRGPAARAQVMELFNDQLGLVAALMGVLMVMWGHPIADPVAAIVVATIIAINAVRLFRDNASDLLGRSPGPEFLQHIADTAMAVDGVRGVHKLRARVIGLEQVHVDMHIEVDPLMPVVDANRVAAIVRTGVTSFTNCDFCTIHIDPVKPASSPGP
jgi:ferrous-iron efflux pump FieF